MNKIATLLLLCTLLCVVACEQKYEPQIGTFTDTRDGKVYKTTKIGEQVWMAENLNYEASGSKCNDNKPANCDKYGRLYNWETAMKACQGGWHLPSKAEWEILMVAVGGKIFGHRIAGKYLKATSGWKDYEGGSGNGNDKYGFSALPGGFCLRAVGNPELFVRSGHVGRWWSSSTTDGDGDGAYTIGVSNDLKNTEYIGYLKREFFSVRCLQD